MKHAVCTTQADADKFKAVFVEDMGKDAWDLRFEDFATQFLRKK